MSLIPEEEVDENGIPPTPYHIETMEQLKHWINKDVELVGSMFFEIRKDYEDVVEKHNEIFRENEDMVRKFEELERKYQSLETLGQQRQNNRPMQSVEIEAKTVTSKKLPDPPVLKR